MERERENERDVKRNKGGIILFCFCVLLYFVVFKLYFRMEGEG